MYMMYNFLTIQKCSTAGSVLTFIFILSILYFLIVRPQIKKQKLEKNFIKFLKEGDNVVTKSGIHGKILKINKHVCIIETVNGKIKLENRSISRYYSKIRYQ